MTISSWSHSRLKDFEACKFKAWLKYDQKIPEPERVLPPGKTEFANDRGTRVHTACEEYVNGTSDEMLPEMMKFADHLTLMRVMYADGLVSLEGEWGIDRDWNIAPWKTAWQRAKLDAMVFHSDTEATVIDFKTGRKFGNELAHGEQLMLYQLLAFMRYPKLETIYAALWYLDHGEITERKFTRSQGIRFKENFDRRGHALTDAVKFPPNPTIFTCRWCQYGPWGTGHCEVGVKK